MNPMQRKFHPMSIEDREMFAYNAEYQKRQLEIARVLSHPEQRIKYCFSSLKVQMSKLVPSVTTRLQNTLHNWITLRPTSDDNAYLQRHAISLRKLNTLLPLRRM
jgi:hypothetical protein